MEVPVFHFIRDGLSVRMLLLALLWVDWAYDIQEAPYSSTPALSQARPVHSRVGNHRLNSDPIFFLPSFHADSFAPGLAGTELASLPSGGQLELHSFNSPTPLLL